MSKVEYNKCVKQGHREAFCRANYLSKAQQKVELNSIHTKNASRKTSTSYGPDPDDYIYQVEHKVTDIAKELHNWHRSEN